MVVALRSVWNFSVCNPSSGRTQCGRQSPRMWGHFLRGSHARSVESYVHAGGRSRRVAGAIAAQDVDFGGSICPASVVGWAFSAMHPPEFMFGVFSCFFIAHAACIRLDPDRYHCGPKGGLRGDGLPRRGRGNGNTFDAYRPAFLNVIRHVGVPGMPSRMVSRRVSLRGGPHVLGFR